MHSYVILVGMHAHCEDGQKHAEYRARSLSTFLALKAEKVVCNIKRHAYIMLATYSIRNIMLATYSIRTHSHILKTFHLSHNHILYTSYDTHTYIHTYTHRRNSTP